MWSILEGLFVLAFASLAVRWLVTYATDGDRPKPPEGLDEQLWSAIVGRGRGGNVLGHLERLLFFASFRQGVPVIIAGWLAFKVASGWQNWNLIVRLPEKLDRVNDLDYLRARSQLGTWIFHRFLIGTLGNVMAGFVAVILAKGS